jgi:hypothetical protein
VKLVSMSDLTGAVYLVRSICTRLISLCWQLRVRSGTVQHCQIVSINCTARQKGQQCAIRHYYALKAIILKMLCPVTTNIYRLSVQKRELVRIIILFFLFCE